MLCVTLLCGMLVACSKVESPETVISNVATDAIVTQFGQNTWQTTLKDHTVSDVQGAFVEAGYQPLDASIVDGATNPPLVLTAKDTQITLYPTEDGVRVMWDSTDRAVKDLLVPNDATGTGEVIMVQVGVARNATTDNPAIGMCYVYKLSDGRAVILDGGIAGNESVIYQTLQKLDIAKDKHGKYQIAAWILSHGHQDHYGAMLGFSSTYAETTSVEYFLYSLPVDQTTLAGVDVWFFVDHLRAYYPKAVHVTPHTGLRYFVGNLTLEMLYTPDMQEHIDYENNTSLIFIADCAGARILHMGDAGELASTTTWELYEKSAFGANVLQITHHGLYTGPDSHKWKNLKNIYSASQATLGLLPMGSRKPGDSRNGRHTVLIGWGGANYQVSFVINKRDNHGQSSISQEYYEQFVAQVAAGTAQHQTLFGYDGINTVTNDDGMITYLSCNETTPMVTLITLSAQGASIAHNQMLYDWFADTATAD